MEKKLETTLFTQNANLWINMALKGQPKFPQTSLKTDPYAYQTMNAAGTDALNCTDYVDQSHLGFSTTTADTDGTTLNAITALNTDMTGNVQYTNCIDLTTLEINILTTNNMSFDNSTAKLNTKTVQSTLKKLKALMDTNNNKNDTNENARSVNHYSNQ